MSELRRYLILTILFLPLLFVSMGPFARAGEETRNVTLTSDADAYVYWQWIDWYGLDRLSPFTYGYGGGMWLFNYGAGQIRSYGFVKFPSPSILAPQYANVISATLRLYYYQTNKQPAGVPIYVSKVTGDWTEADANSATWTTEGRVSTPCPSSFGWVSFDVTAIVQKWLNWPSPEPNYGFQIELPVVGPADVYFYTREISNYAPQLIIQYTASFTTTTAQTARTETMPITVVLPCTKDATLDIQLPSSRYGLILDVRLYRYHDGTSDYGIIAFDDPISKIPPGSTIISAAFCASGSHISALRFYRVTAPWAERTVCWANRPSYDPSAYRSRSYTDGLAYFVQLWLDGTPNHGLFMENYLSADECWFWSRQKTEYPPALVVSFMPPSLTGFGWTTVSTATISTWYPGSTATIEETLSYRISTASLPVTTTWHTTTTTSTGTVTSLTFVTTTTTTLLLAPAPINALYNRTRTHTQTNGGE